MPVSKEDVLRVAQLAQLEISNAALDDVTGRFSRILDMVDALGSVDTAGVEPMSNPHDAVQTLRADQVTCSDQRDAILRNAPAAADGYFLVPKVVE